MLPMGDPIPTPPLLTNGPAEGRPVVLAHGAGAPMDSPFMETMAEGLAEAGLRVVRFEFPYMQARRAPEPRKKPPDREPVLRACWHAVIEQLGGGGGVVIGGKSMGGRIASMIADEAEVAGLVCLGYPFHPPGRPEKLRTAHLAELRTPTLIVQGERDPFGKREETRRFKLSETIEFAWIPDGDHSLKPRVKSGRTEAQNLADAIAAIAEFAGGLST